MIYIDPPYNTGNDFIYPDNFSESLQTYLEYTGQVDAEGRKFGTNTEADGRFHSKWLNMMYPRLYLARNLLREDGTIFVSCDDNEVQNLRAAMNEVFGEENFIASVIWQKVFSPKNSAKHFSADHDYIVVYARRADIWRPELLPRTEEMEARYDNPDNDPRGPWNRAIFPHATITARGSTRVDLSFRARGRGTAAGQLLAGLEGEISGHGPGQPDLVGQGRQWHAGLKRFLSDVKQGRVPQTFWPYSEVGHTQDAKKELMEYVTFEHADNVLDTVKPVALIRRMLQLSTRATDGDIVLDFFAGSGPTGHARHRAKCGRRREPPFCSGSTSRAAAKAREGAQNHRGYLQRARAAGYSKARCRGHRQARSEGRREARIAASASSSWRNRTSNHGMPKPRKTPAALAEQLELHIDHIRDGRTADDILYELLLKSGFPLTTPVETEDARGQDRLFRRGRRVGDLPGTRTYSGTHPRHRRHEAGASRVPG